MMKLKLKEIYIYIYIYILHNYIYIYIYIYIYDLLIIYLYLCFFCHIDGEEEKHRDDDEIYSHYIVDANDPLNEEIDFENDGPLNEQRMDRVPSMSPVNFAGKVASVSSSKKPFKTPLRTGYDENSLIAMSKLLPTRNEATKKRNNLDRLISVKGKESENRRGDSLEWLRFEQQQQREDKELQEERRREERETQRKHESFQDERRLEEKEAQKKNDMLMMSIMAKIFGGKGDA